MSNPNNANNASSTGKQAVTVIGLGPMGRAMAAAYLKAGYAVTVWNRTAAKADELVAQGAVRAATPAEALAANELVVLSLTDYDACYAVLDGATAALAGRVLVNLTSDTPEKARTAAKWADGHGARHLTGGVQVPPPLIGQEGAATFYSGPREVFEAHRPALEVLTAADFRGTDPGLAQVYYQALMAMFWSSMTGYLHAVALMRANGVTAEEFRPHALKAADVSYFIGEMGARLDVDRHDTGADRLAMDAASADHVVHTLKDAGLDTEVPAALAAFFHRGVAAGHGEGSFTGLIGLLERPAG
ncbi:NAD(P)-dependent oxidoreductase [Streptomyces chattanoogensis]|uniref:NAD(P)-dependent oxidoreductase n=1 Tax=Streptomyces chattanoogensis TaxID=66876 RepID=UPI00369F9BA8